MSVRGGRAAVAAGAAALALLAGQGAGAWAADGGGPESVVGAAPGAGSGTAPGTGVGAEPAPVPGGAPQPEPAPGGVPAPAPDGVPAPGAGGGPGKAPVPVDVVSRLYPDDDLIAPGLPLGIRAVADVEKGSVTKLGLTLKLPAGVTYVKDLGNASNGVCEPSANGRSVSCVPGSAGDLELLSAYMQVKVGADVAPGTELEFTTTADIGDAVDSKPENNVASAKVGVRVPADLGIEWTTAPKGPVKVGESVPTEVTVTNHGPGPVRVNAAHLDIGFDYWPELGYDSACVADPGVLYCDIEKDLERGESVKFAFTWKFPKKAAGTVFRVPTRIYSSSPLDGNRANDRTELVFRIAKSASPSPSPSPSGTPKPTPTPTASPSSVPSPAGGGGRLAETGAGFPVAGLTAGAGALVLTGGALVVVRRRRSS